MRFSSLELIRYGHFQDCRLDFPDQAPDLHIVFGPNEAGKSTTMAAVGDLLFGFPHRTPYDFRFDKQLLRVGAGLQEEGAALDCQRKKGRSGTLLDPRGGVLDEGALTAMLRGHTAESFQRMFSLDHGRLRQGGRAILAAQDDIGQAIFAAGSGLVGVTAILAALEEEAKAIWTRRAGGDRRYHAAQSAYDEARARQRAAQVRPAAWEELRREVERLDGELAALRLRRGELSRQREAAERRRRVLPQAALYRRTQAELATLGETPDFPPDAAEILDQATAALAAADVDAALAEGELARTREALGLIMVDPRLIEREAEIEALRDIKGAVDKSLRDLPRLRAELTAPAARLAGLQRELAWPAEDAKAVQARLPRRVSVADARALLERRSALEATLAAATADETAARQAMERQSEDLARLPPAPELTDLAAAARLARTLGDVDGAVAAARRDAEQRRAALAGEMSQLRPWTGDPAALRGLILPSEAETASALADQTQAEAALAEAQRAWRQQSDRQAQLDLERLHLVRDESAVPPAAVEAARQGRDALWRGVRAQLTGEEPLADPAGAAAAFEGRMGEADALADRRFAAAEQSARLVALRGEIERNALAVAQQADAVARAGAAVEAAARAWRGRLAAEGLDVDPRAFGAWMERRRRALNAAADHEAAAERLADAEARLSAGRAQLSAALAAAEAPVAEAAPFARLMQAAEAAEAAGSEALRQRRELALKAGAAEEAQRAARAKRAVAEAALADWEIQWARAVKAAELDAGVSHAVVRKRLDLVDEARAAVDEILGLQRRIAGMETDAADFAARAVALARACGLDPAGRTPAEIAAVLTVAVRDAVAARRQGEALCAQLAAAEGRLADAQAARARALARIRPLVEIAGSEDRAELAAAIRRSRQARDLLTESNRLIEEILRAGAGPRLDALLAEADGGQDADLVVRAREIQDELEGVAETLARLAGEQATAYAEFARIDDGPAAAVAAADAEQAKAEMAVQAEAYVRKRAEAALLRWAIARYRSRKQTPLLRRAAGLFERLTLGRYGDLLVDLDAEKASLAALARDQSVVPVEGMSEGTVDQLFLALRLAAVEDAVDAGARLPFLADDLFINYDDDRAAAGLQVLAELAHKTQVLFFTHHHHLVALAERALGPAAVSVCALG